MALKPNYYETLYVVRPDLKEEELSKIQSKLPEFIQAHEGEVMKSDKWAERELAYEIQDHKRGTYYILIYKALPTVTREIEKHLRFYNTDVLRFMTTKINEEVAVREKNAASEKSAEESKAEEAPAAPPQKEEEAPAAVEPVAPQAEAPQEEAPAETPPEPEAPVQETQVAEPVQTEQAPETASSEESTPQNEDEGGKE